MYKNLLERCALICEIFLVSQIGTNIVLEMLLKGVGWVLCRVVKCPRKVFFQIKLASSVYISCLIH